MYPQSLSPLVPLQWNLEPPDEASSILTVVTNHDPIELPLKSEVLDYPLLTERDAIVREGDGETFNSLVYNVTFTCRELPFLFAYY